MEAAVAAAVAPPKTVAASVAVGGAAPSNTVALPVVRVGGVWASGGGANPSAGTASWALAMAIGLVPGKVTIGFDNAKGLKGTLLDVDAVVAVIVGVVLTRGLGGCCCSCCCC